MNQTKRAYLITGASRGIGSEIARALINGEIHHSDASDESPLVIITARSRGALDTLAGELPGQIETVAADISNEEGRKRLFESTKEILKKRDLRLSGLVNNAGLLRAKPFLELSEKDWDDHYRVNLLAPAMLIKDLSSLFEPQGGHILNISSMGGFQGSRKFPGLSAYSAMKGGLAILTEALAGELETLKISVNALCLGAVQTEMLEQAFPGFEAPVQAEDMGSWIADFLHNGHRFFNGKILPVSLTDPQ